MKLEDLNRDARVKDLVADGTATIIDAALPFDAIIAAESPEIDPPAAEDNRAGSERNSRLERGEMVS